MEGWGAGRLGLRGRPHLDDSILPLLRITYYSVLSTQYSVLTTAHPDDGILLLQPHVRPVAAEELPVKLQRLQPYVIEACLQALAACLQALAACLQALAACLQALAACL